MGYTLFVSVVNLQDDNNFINDQLMLKTETICCLNPC
jgi:hypothetical protein